jgi:cell division GTPase FtsZ
LVLKLDFQKRMKFGNRLKRNCRVITHHYTQNIDLRDAKTVLSNSGTAIMGSAVSEGENRAKEAIISALDSPLNDNKITGAKTYCCSSFQVLMKSL